MCLKFVFVLILANYFTTSSECARILGIIPTPSYSHQVVYHPLWRELSLRGHQVTVLTTDPINDPSLTNLTEIDLHFTYKFWNDHLLNIIDESQKGLLETFNVFMSVLHELTIQELEHPEVQKLIKNETEHFDLLLIEFNYPTMIAFAERFKCPAIGMSSMDMPSVAYEMIGSPTHPLLYPDPVLPFAGELTFTETLISTIMPIFTKLYSNMYTLPLEQSTVEKYFGSNYSSLEELVGRMSMFFVNTDPILHTVRPLVPAIVQIGGGIHIKPSKPLPQNLQTLLDSAKEGFIYFSLGTNVKSKDLPEDTRNTILQAFAELPYTVLWKFEMEHLPGKPHNVYVSKWFPQQDVFRHPNIKLFITQGGAQSTEEAISFHIPIIGMPFFADQQSNIRRLLHKGIGLAVDHKTMNKDQFKQTILEVIDNPKYRNRVKELAELVKDQPMTGLERAVWWSEYVIRHKGANHLRSPAIDLPFYQYFLLDVIGFCVLVLVILIYLILLAIRLIKYFLTKLILIVKGEQKVKLE